MAVPVSIMEPKPKAAQRIIERTDHERHERGGGINDYFPFRFFHGSIPIIFIAPVLLQSPLCLKFMITVLIRIFC